MNHALQEGMRSMTFLLLAFLHLQPGLALATPKKLPPLRKSTEGKFVSDGLQSCQRQDSSHGAAHSSVASVSNFLQHAVQLDPIQQEYQTIQRLADIENYAQSGDWAFLDIDEVLIKQTVGVNEDGTYKVNTRLVSPDTQKVLERLRLKGVKLFGLTSRSLSDSLDRDSQSDTALDQLASVGIYMDSIPLYRNAKEKDNPKYRHFYQGKGSVNKKGIEKFSGYCLGTIFVNHGDKGAGLTNFISEVNKNGIAMPQRVLFVDDKKINVESVKKALSKTAIQHHCFHFVPAPSGRKLSLPELEPMRPPRELLENIKRKGQRRQSLSHVQLAPL